MKKTGKTNKRNMNVDRLVPLPSYSERGGIYSRNGDAPFFIWIAYLTRFNPSRWNVRYCQFHVSEQVLFYVSGFCISIFLFWDCLLWAEILSICAHCKSNVFFPNHLKYKCYLYLLITMCFILGAVGLRTEARRQCYVHFYPSWRLT